MSLPLPLRRLDAASRQQLALPQRRPQGWYLHCLLPHQRSCRQVQPQQQRQMQRRQRTQQLQ